MIPERPGWLESAPRLPDADGAPAHATIARWLIELISAGELIPGDRLPPEQELARELGVSRMTLRQALSTLESQSRLRRRTGRAGGTFVSEPRIECDLTGLAGFTEQMRRSNLRAGARVVSAATRPASRAVARALLLGPAAPVHEVVRVRTARREPLALERSYFPEEVFPDLLEHRLTGSIYDLLGRCYGQAPRSAVESLEAVVARGDEARLLTIAPSSPLLLIERTASTGSGLPVEFARDLFRPDRIRISLTTGAGVAPRLRSSLDQAAGDS